MAKKPKQTDLENLPPTVAEFIKLVIKKMRYRRKVRAEVMAELAAHFEDALKDCKTDQEKQQRAKQLIAEFGDVKLLGVLLRRAKKRCRPLWRTVTARTFQTLGVLILCFILYVTWFLTGKPNITTDYIAQLNQMLRPAADESLNAAPLYHKATELYSQRWDDLAELRSKSLYELTAEQYQQLRNEIPMLLAKKYDQVTSEQKQRVRKWLTRNEEIFDFVIAGTQKPYYWQSYDEAGGVEGTMETLLPKLNRLKKLAHALRWRACSSAEQTRFKEAFNDMKACYRLGQHVKANGTLIEQLVGIAIEALAVGRLSDILAEYEIDSVTLADFQNDFEQTIAHEDFSVHFEAERLFTYDAIQRCFTEDRFGGGHLCVDGLKMIRSLTGDDLVELVLEKGHWTMPLHILFTHPNKHQTREIVDRLYDFWDDMARKTPAQLRAEGIDLEERLMEIVKGNLLLEISAPALGRVNELAHRNKIQNQALLPIIALLRYKNDKGLCPENLQELITAAYLKELPIDPYSDKPLVYRKTDDNFLLYSIGPDFEDDGGQVVRDDKGRLKKWGRQGDTVFWPASK